MIVDAARLAAVISPLRRTLLTVTRARADLPDIPDAQVEILRALPRGTAVSPGELAATLGLRKSSVSNLLAAMERAGLISRRPSPDDGRGVQVRASETALDHFEAFDATSSSVILEAVARLETAEQQVLADAVPVLERLRNLVGESGRAPDSTSAPAAEQGPGVTP
ncbi:MarR family transcriptional regulator [Arthrobacter sp. Y-9]|uniref:MarR family winged helix-turn-helix transcriptional regulator n=1 Tax=Arthrobacter sp. Y-9 TaxID=3039385 RepID=UPI00241FE844|nr:MarR family transcriptional regulator [Arthrobacter sp. Y-9]WFR82511.1 MarR family transcriptional regulator [Arthrobacter sp. Y-9]